MSTKQRMVQVNALSRVQRGQLPRLIGLKKEHSKNPDSRDMLLENEFSNLRLEDVEDGLFFG